MNDLDLGALPVPSCRACGEVGVFGDRCPDCGLHWHHPDFDGAHPGWCIEELTRCVGRQLANAHTREILEGVR